MEENILITTNSNWSETVEDLLDGGDTDKAINHLESVVSSLETLKISEESQLQLSSALLDLSKLYSSQGFSLKADATRSRAHVVRHQSFHKYSGLDKDCGSHDQEVSSCNANYDDGSAEKCSTLLDNSVHSLDDSDDDWEAVADRAPDELLSPHCLPGLSKVPLDAGGAPDLRLSSQSLAASSKVPFEDARAQKHKRRGRGTFSYQKDGLYSDQQSDGLVHDSETEAMSNNSEGDAGIREFKYGTRHALVLAGFAPSMRTIDLEKLFENFKDRGVVIRWLDDTTALAVFRTPTIALEACNCIECPFTVRLLDENDELLGSIKERDLEPPRPRPKTSARTAERLIAHGMGLKLPSKSFGSKELRKQEEDRRSRIVTRQTLRDDAWGEDVN